MLIAWLTAALAAPVVLPGPDVPRAERRIRADLLVRDAEARSIRDLPRDGRPYLVRAGPWARCAGDPTDNATILRLLGEAEELRVVMRPGAWFDRLLQAQRAWICLAEPADATLGARLHFLLGIAHHARGDAVVAGEAFRAALRSDPDLRWDDDFAPDGRPMFESVRAAPPPAEVRVTVVPADAPVALRIDGRSVALREGGFDVAAGPHVLQIDGEARLADLRDDDWLVIPRYVDDALLAEIGEAAGRQRVAGLLQDVSEPVLVPDERSTWRYASGAWSEHRAPAARRLSRPLTAAGVAAVVAGAAWMAAEGLAASGRAADVDDGLSSADYAALQQRHDAGRTRFWVAGGAVGLGAVVTGVGATMVVSSWH